MAVGSHPIAGNLSLSFEGFDVRVADLFVKFGVERVFVDGFWRWLRPHVRLCVRASDGGRHEEAAFVLELTLRRYSILTEHRCAQGAGGDAREIRVVLVAKVPALGALLRVSGRQRAIGNTRIIQMDGPFERKIGFVGLGAPSPWWAHAHTKWPPRSQRGCHRTGVPRGRIVR